MGIVGALLLGWFLGLFGFKGVVMAGMLQLFGIKISVLTYYFIFACLGVFTWVVRGISRLFRKPKAVELDINAKNFKEALEQVKEVLKK